MSSFLDSLSPTLADGPVSQLLAMGGPVMIVLLVLAVLGLVTFVYLVLLGAVCAPRMTRKLKTTITVWQQSPSGTDPATIRKQASRWARLNPLHNLITQTIEARQAGQDEQTIRDVTARDAQQGLEPFEGPLKVIEVIAALAPLLGLLGTVLGMMEAFSAMAATEGRANASQLSGGIYEALTTTAAGLVVAIPFAALAAWVEFRLRRIHKVVNSALVSVLSVTPEAGSHQAVEPGIVTDQAAEEVASPTPARAEKEQEYTHHGRHRFAHATG